MKKGIILTLACLVTITSFAVKPIYAYDYQTICNNNSTNEIQTRKDILIWIHKTINGKKYKRLWNASKGVWLTKWILEE